jgi:protein disulfide-isomerase A1
MGFKRLLLLLLVLCALCLHCAGNQDPTELETEEDLEDLEDGLDDGDDVGAASSSAADALAASKVANVNDQDVERVVAKLEYLLLLGFAPWDTQSQDLLPEFAAAAMRLAQLGNPCVLAKLDAVNNPSAASRYQIRGFPTIVFFVNGSRQAYSGGFSRAELVLWVRKQTGDAVTTITSKDEAEAFVRKNVTTAIGYFANLEGPEHAAFVAAAQADNGIEFVQTTAPEAAEVLLSPSVKAPSLALRKQEPEQYSPFDGRFSKEEVMSFVAINKHPLITILNSKNANTVYGSTMKMHVLLFAKNEDYEIVKSVYLEAAKDFKGKIMFLVIDMEDRDFAMPMLGVYGLDIEKPVVAGLNNEDGARYVMESDLTVANLKKFATDLYARELSTYFKSEPVPSENDGLVKKVVGKTFEEIVMDDSKDVFLEIHAPWCQPCEKVSRIFEKLAKHVKDVPSLVMARLDAQANEHPLLQDVLDYPSLLLYPAGKKSTIPIAAPTKTTWKKLLTFLNENVAIPFPETEASVKEEL